MLENSNMLDLAIEQALEKSTSNARAHISAATMSQEDHDKHTDALAHHAGAIEYYRNKPEVKNTLEKISREAVPLREFVNKPLKLEGGNAPQITADDLNKEHPKLQGRTDLNEIAGAVNNKLSELHKAFNSSPDLKALSSHSKRFLGHMSAMLEWHNLQKKGEGAHHQFVGKVEGPELQGNYEDSKYRGHSTPSATDRNKFRTQAITKQGGAKWHPGLPELTSLEEASGHSSAGKSKELYPFREIKVNGEALQPHAFTDEAPPAQIHAQDYATNLTKDHQVIAPGEQSPTQAMGGYHGTKGASQNAAGMERVGLFKKSMEADICSYFPQVTLAHYVLAKNLLSALNPFGDMDDESFGDYVVSTMTHPESSKSTCAAILAEAESRLEKAKKDDETRSRPAISHREWQKGVDDVMTGKVVPLPHTEAAARSKKEDEKRSELEDLGYQAGQRKRSPYAAPKEVFTDDTYTKVDPEKYKEWVNGPMNEQDLRNEHATYNSMIKYNPEAQKRHKAYVDMERETSKEKLGRATMGGDDAEKPHLDHKAVLAQAGKDLQSGKITPQEFAQISTDSAKKKASLTSHKAAGSELTPEEQKIKEADPKYQPRRAGSAEQAAASSEKDLTSLAHGKIPSHMLADKDAMGGNLDEEHGDAQAREITHQRGGEEGQSTISGSTSQSPSPIQLINEHPGFKNYLKFKEHMLSHYKSPEVRKYMEDKINQHENDPNMDPDKLAGIYHLLHRAKDSAQRESAGQSKLMGDIAAHPTSASPAEETSDPVGEPSADQMKQKVQQYMSTRPTKEPMPTPSNIPEPPKEEAKPAVAPAPKTVIRRTAKQ